MEQRNVALYCRVSTDDQDNSRQRADLRQWASRMGWEVVAELEDRASGAARVRANRQKLISIAKQPALAKPLLAPGIAIYPANAEQTQCRPIDAILVTELSRWSRSLTDLVATLDDLGSHGISVLTLNGLSLDLSTSTGKLTTQIIGAVAEFERDLIRERTKSGLAHAKSKGVVLGRPPGSRSKHWKHYKEVIRLEGTHSIRRISALLDIPATTIVRMIAHHKATRPTSQNSSSSASPKN